MARSEPGDRTAKAHVGFSRRCNSAAKIALGCGVRPLGQQRGGDYLLKDKRDKDNVIPGKFVCWPGWLRRRLSLKLSRLIRSKLQPIPNEEVNVKLFDLLPFLDLPCQCSLTIAPPIDLIVKQALARLESQPSRQWLDAIGRLETGRPVRLEVSLEELALLLERVDFSSGRIEDIEAIGFWNHLQASCELLEALGHEWSNHLGFDCHDSFALAWCVPEGMVGYLAWLARSARPVPTVPGTAYAT